MLSSTRTPSPVVNDNPKVSLVNLRRLAQMPSHATMERCCFLFVHLFFYTIILIIVYVRLEQFNTKHERLLTALHSNRTRAQSVGHQSLGCACSILPYPRRNRTTNCLQIRVGLLETLNNVFCATSKSNPEINPWLVIQSRQSNQVAFNRTWMEYRRGFGNVLQQKDFWIGNENLYWLTNKYQCRLKIELTDWYNETRLATYEVFQISSQTDEYRIQLDEYHGNMEMFKKVDSFSRWHYNAPFSTHDHYATDHTNCPQSHGGVGWWYHFGHECAHVQLNGQIPTHTDGLVPLNTGIVWLGWKSDRHYSFQRVQMAIQRKFKHAPSSHRRQ